MLIERVTLSVEIEVDVAHLAKQFAELSDDAQAQFLCLAAKGMGEAVEVQAMYIGRHLRTCDCSTEEGRAFVRELARSLEDKP